MKAVLKFLVIATGLFLIALTLIAFLLSARLESFARAGLEKSLSTALGVPVTIEGIDAAPVQEAVIVRGLHVGMPEELGSGDALFAPSILISVHTRSLLHGKPVIRLIRVESPEVTLRQELGNGISIAPLLRPAKETPGDSNDGQNEGFTIQKVEITEGKLIVEGKMLPGGLSGTLPAVTLENVDASAPLTAANTLRTALRAALAHVVTGQNLGIPALDSLGDLLKPLGKTATPAS